MAALARQSITRQENELNEESDYYKGGHRNKSPLPGENVDIDTEHDDRATEKEALIELIRGILSRKTLHLFRRYNRATGYSPSAQSNK